MATRAGGEKRGNAEDRRRRKRWMLETFGDGTTCPCAHCGTALTFDTVEADRIVPGGSYRRENIQPACRACNVLRSDDTTWSFEVAIQLGKYRATAGLRVSKEA